MIVFFIGTMFTRVQDDDIASNANAVMNTNINSPNLNGVLDVNANTSTVVPVENLNMNMTGNQNINSEDALQTYENRDVKLSLKHPDTMNPESNFMNTYLLPDTWNALSPQSTTGNKLVAFKIPGSNDITSAGIRISTSKNSVDIAACTTTPSNASFEKTTRVINGNTYTVLALSEGAMNHYSTINSYRLVKNNLCYVIDTYVTGTNPEVYDPKPTPPFTKDSAFTRIDAILGTLSIE